MGAIGGSRLQDNLGQLHIVTGSITYSGGTPQISTNDRSFSTEDPTDGITDNSDGNTTVTWQHPWLSAPKVVLTALDASATAEAQIACTLVANSATSFQFVTSDHVDAGITAADTTVEFIAIGLRDN